MNHPGSAHVLGRIRAEYLEMPGLTLTPEQVQRLCGVDGVMCKTALQTLVETGFLSMRADGAYRRFRDPDISRVRSVKAGLEWSMVASMSRLRPRAS